MARYDHDRTNAIIAMRDDENRKLKQEEKEQVPAQIPDHIKKRIEELKSDLDSKKLHPEFGNRPVIPPPKS